MNIFVSSLSFRARREDLEKLFAPFGEVSSARIITDKTTHRSKGYGFVEMNEEDSKNESQNNQEEMRYNFDEENDNRKRNSMAFMRNEIYPNKKKK